MGNDITVVLQDSGACTMRPLGSTISGAWTEGEGGVTIGTAGRPVFFALEKGILSGEDGGCCICFARDVDI